MLCPRFVSDPQRHEIKTWKILNFTAARILHKPLSPAPLAMGSVFHPPYAFVCVIGIICSIVADFFNLREFDFKAKIKFFFLVTVAHRTRWIKEMFFA